MSRSLAERLRDPDPEERRRACRDAVDDPAAALFLEALGEALADPEKAVAQAAGEALVRLGRRHEAVRGVLRQALHGESRAGRLAAALASARLEPPGPALLPALVAGLAQADGDLRWAAARALVAAGRGHPEVLTLLLGLLRGDADATVRGMAAHCLRELGPDRPEVAQALLEVCDDAEPAARRAAYTALASLLDPPRAVRERLERAARQEPDGPARRLAGLALERLASGPDQKSSASRE